MQLLFCKWFLSVKHFRLRRRTMYFHMDADAYCLSLTANEGRRTGEAHLGGYTET